MATPKKKKPALVKRVGPFLQTALIAEKILSEPDGTVTIVRVVDRIGLQTESINHPENATISLNLTILIGLKAGGFKGKGTVTIVQVGPAGKNQAIGKAEFTFDGTQSAGYNTQAPCLLKWEGDGQYWYEIFLNDRFLSRIPLQVAQGNLPEPEKKKK
jgi:hypothetical protein